MENFSRRYGIEAEGCTILLITQSICWLLLLHRLDPPSTPDPILDPFDQRICAEPVNSLPLREPKILRHQFVPYMLMLLYDCWIVKRSLQSAVEQL